MEYEISEYNPSYTLVLVILDPVDRKVYTWGRIVSGSPGPVWHRRHITLAALRPDFVGASLEAELREREADIVAIADAYIGDEWDYVGRWADDVDDLTGPIEDALEHGTAVARYWDAGDWLGGDPDTVLGDALLRGDIVASATAEVEQAKDQGAHIKQSDAERYIRSLAEERISDLADDEDDVDEDDAAELTRLRALLGVEIDDEE